MAGWFTISTQGAAPPAESPLVSGTLVALYNYKFPFFYQIGPSGVDGKGQTLLAPAGAEPGVNKWWWPDRSGEFMVELLAGHDTADDLRIRLISNPSSGSGRYVSWPTPDDDQAVADSSVDPMDRGDADLSETYQLTLTPWEESAAGFYALVTSGGQQYYLCAGTVGESDGKPTFGYHLVAAGVSPPPDVILIPGVDNSSVSPVWAMDIISTSVTDTMTETPKAYGKPIVEQGPTTPVAPDDKAAWIAQNPDSTMQKAGKGTFEHTTEVALSYAFHWDITASITAEAGFDIGVGEAKVSVSVGTDVGSSTEQSQSTATTLTQEIRDVDVEPHSQRVCQVSLAMKTIEQQFNMALKRVVKNMFAVHVDTYNMKILGYVSTQEPALTDALWGPNEKIQRGPI